MIFALSRSVEAYNVETENGLFGLWQSYGYDPHLFCLLSRTCLTFFMYEEIFDGYPPEKRVCEVKNISYYTDTLDYQLGGRTFRQILEDTTPREFADLLRDSGGDDIPICQPFKEAHFPSPRKMDGVWFIAYIRALQYEKFYRGVTGGDGKVRRAVFCSPLTQEEDDFLEQHKMNIRVQMEEELYRGGISK